MRPFVAVDWGTSSFRLWSLSADAEVLARTDGPFGMANLERAAFGGVLEGEIAKLGLGAEVPALVCGMAGAAQGWCEAPYLAAPTALSRLAATAVRVPGSVRDVRILPGVMQAAPADVMRGEETQIAGFLAERPDHDGVLCLPGTHTKWVRVQGGRIERFVTCMTGELFALLAERSVLRHSTAGGSWDHEAFESAVAEVLAEPAGLAAALFGVRAGTLLDGLSPAVARSRLSGLLIGLELAATRAWWVDADVALIGDAALCRHYADALAQPSVSADVLDGEALTLGGLVSAFERLEHD